MSANEHDDDQPDSFEVIERLRARVAKLEALLEEAAPVIALFSPTAAVLARIDAALSETVEA